MTKTLRNRVSRLLALALLLLTVNFSAPAQSPRPAGDLKPTVILISLDGFRADYLAWYKPPTLLRLARTGVRARWMTPSFPSKTFPNHYAIATGLYPQNNGIVENNIYDRETKVTFSMDNRPEVQNGRWWLGEPIWITAEKQGQRAAPFFFPGSEAEIGGVRPTYWKPYNGKVTNSERVDTLLGWLDLPASERPTFLSLYFSDVDDAGHGFSPHSVEAKNAVLKVDHDLDRMIEGLNLAALRQPTNLIIVSDHGMAATSPDRVVWIHDIADPADYHVVEEGTVAMIDAQPGHEAVLAASLLRPHDHVTCLRKQDMPARLHYGRNPRVTAFVCMADMGWLLFDVFPKKWGIDLGSHGYDNLAPEMQAIFIAAGPNIAPRGKLPTFDNVDVYPLVRDLLRLPPVAGIDGTDAPFRKALRHR